MANYIAAFQTLADYQAAQLNFPNVSLIESDGSLIYEKEAPTPPPISNCSIIISEPITSYTANTYDTVYSTADAKWFILNNLSQYEEYGIYETGTSLSDFTTYEGKLAAIGTTEYQFNNDSWEEVGTYEDSSVTYEIDRTARKYNGQTLSTTFKIPMSDVESVGTVDMTIRSMDSEQLRVKFNGEMVEYTYQGVEYYQGTVTDDGEYYYLSLPSEAPQSIVIDRTQYTKSTPIHIIADLKNITVEYEDKEVPSYTIYNTVETMEEVSCPDVMINEYAFVDNNLYKYFESNEWDGVSLNDPKMVAFYADDNPMIVYNNGNSTLDRGETKADDISPISVYIGNGVTSIGDEAFGSCSSLTSCAIGSGVTSIGNNAFGYSSSLTSIDIPSGVTTIGGYAFQGCSGLTSINIPNSVTNIGGNAFNDTPWWNTYSADTSHQYGNIIYINDIAYKATSTGITSVSFRDNTVLIGGDAFSNCTSLTSIVIPDSVTSIGSYAFFECKGLTSCTIGSGVTSIGDGAFEYCSGLTSIDIPDSVTSIGNNAFNSCRSLTSIDIPDGVTEIGAGAFGFCSSLTSIDIPSGVTSIGDGAFEYCSGLTSITVNATVPPTLGTSVFADTSCPILVPSQSVEAYKTAWSDYADRIQAIQ